MTHIGLIEDNRDFRIELNYNLRRAGFEISFESDGTDDVNQLDYASTDIVLLDLGLPVEDGLVISDRIRQKHPDIGIVILTARDKLESRLEGLQAGADAYLVKPVVMQELIAILINLKRRLAKTDNEVRDAWQLNPLKLSIDTPDGRTIPLSLTEVAILKEMAEVAPNFAYRADLAIAIGHPELDFDFRRLEVAISRLRQKLKTNDRDTPLIRSVRGQGYQFTALIQIISDK